MTVYGFWGMVVIWAMIGVGGCVFIGLAIKERRKWRRRLL